MDPARPRIGYGIDPDKIISPGSNGPSFLGGNLPGETADREARRRFGLRVFMNARHTNRRRTEARDR